VQGIRATGNLFDVMGAHARIGRLLQAGDERPGAEPVVVLAEPFWIRRFGGDRALSARPIRLNSEEYTVVGVLAAGFVMPSATSSSFFHSPPIRIRGAGLAIP